MQIHADPIPVEVTRGTLVESRHRVHAALVNGDGDIVAAWGDIEQHIYPRSSIKPLQALPLVESGAADAFDLSVAELALACSSHQSEPMHTGTVSKWLARIGCSADDLECAGHLPRHDGAMLDLVRSRAPVTTIYNNCSGKHTGFLTTARHLGEPTKGYSSAAHPVQQRLAALLSELGGADLTDTERGIDGCGIPVIGMSLQALARAMGRMAAPETMDDKLGQAAKRIVEAMTTHPEMVRGTNGFDTLMMAAGKGRYATKTGAEGVHIAIVPRRRLGIAVKAEDGNTRASSVALGALLDDLGLVPDNARGKLRRVMAPTVTNAAGKPVGEIRVGPGWLD